MAKPPLICFLPTSTTILQPVQFCDDMAAFFVLFAFSV